MGVVLLKAATFILIIAIGYEFKRRNIFSVEDSKFLGKLIINITLPAALIVSFKDVKPSNSLLIAIVFGVILNLIMMVAGKFAARKRTGKEQALFMLTSSGYNIGNFAMPFVQSFFPSSAVAAVCMFDIGNAIMSNGATYAFASGVAGGESRVGIKEIFKKLATSPPLVTYLIMLFIAFVGIRLPEGFYNVAGVFGSGNAFLSMLMIGIIFKVNFDKEDIKIIGSILSLRYIFAIAFALIILFVLPMPLEDKQVLAVIVFSPITSVSSIYCAKCGCDDSIAGVLNSLSIVISITFFIFMLVFLHI